MAARDMDLFLVAEVTKAAAPPDQLRDETLRLFDPSLFQVPADYSLVSR
jgi:hypothetical protein